MDGSNATETNFDVKYRERLEKKLRERERAKEDAKKETPVVLKAETKVEVNPKVDEESKEENEGIDIAHILTELKFISEIKPGNKLCYANDEMNIDNSYFPFLSRWYNNYNRKDTIGILETIYNKSFDLVALLVKNQKSNITEIQGYKNTDLLQELIKHMDNSVAGLTALTLTYTEDKHTVSKIDILIKKIALQKQYANENVRFCNENANKY